MYKDKQTENRQKAAAYVDETDTHKKQSAGNSLTPPPLQFNSSSKNHLIETQSDGASQVRQLRVDREDGRPVRKEDEFQVPETRRAFRSALVQWIHPLVMTERQDILVNQTNLAVIWNAFRRFAGQSIHLTIEFDWGTNRIEQIRVIIPGDEIVISPSPTDSSSDEQEPQVGEVPGVDAAATEIQDRASTPSRNPIDRALGTGASPATSGAVTVGRIGAMAAGKVALETSFAALGAVISCFNLAWSVFMIFREIHGERAAGLGCVDYAGMLAAWMLNNQGDSTHSQAIIYARAMEQHRGEGEVYREAIRAARTNAQNAWRQIQRNPEDVQRIQNGFQGNTQALHDALIEKISPHVSNWRVKDAYLPAYHRQWKAQRNFFLR